MTMSDKMYQFFKWLLIIVVPAFITLLTLLTKAWAWDIPIDSIVATISGIATFIGVCVGISNANYYKDNEPD